MPAYRLTGSQLHINRVRRLLRVAINVKDRVDFEVRPLFWSSIGRLFGVAVHVENCINLEVGSLRIG